MPDLTIYEKPTCTTCRKLIRGDRAVLARPVERALERID